MPVAVVLRLIFFPLNRKQFVMVVTDASTATTDCYLFLKDNYYCKHVYHNHLFFVVAIEEEPCNIPEEQPDAVITPCEYDACKYRHMCVITQLWQLSHGYDNFVITLPGDRCLSLFNRNCLKWFCAL